MVKDRQDTASRSPVRVLHFKISWLLLLIISIILSLVVPLVLGGFSQFRLLKRLTWWAAISLVMLALVSWFFNALRTRMLMKSLGIKINFIQAALTSMSAEFAGVATPGSVGMPATYTFLFHHRGVTVGEAIGLVSVIVVTDIIYFGVIMTLAALAEVFTGAVNHKIFKLMVSVMSAVVGGGLLLWALILYHRPICSFVGQQMGKVSWLARRRYRLARGTVNFIRAFRALKKMSWLKLTKLFFITLGFWLPRYLVLVLVIDLVGYSVPLSYLVLVQGILNLGGQLFLVPGGGGPVDAGYAALLSPYLPREPLAFTLLIWRAVNFYWFLIVGGPIFIFSTGEAARSILGRKR